MASGLAVVLHEDTDAAPVVKDVLEGYLDELEERTSGRRKLDWLGTGLKVLDSLVGGWCPGELIIIAARPSIGKTAFGLATARHRAETRGVLFFSSEMSRRAVGERLLAMESRVDLQDLRLASDKAPVRDEDWQRLVEAYARLGPLDLAIDDKPGIDMRYIRSQVREHQMQRAKGKRGPLRDIVIDYLQLLQGHGPSLREIITQIAKDAKTLAREENVAVLLLSQLKRPTTMKGEVPPPPNIHELKESGAIEETADTVILLDRPEYYLESAGKPVGEHASVAYAHVAKQRQGPVGRVTLGFRKSSTLFADVWWTGRTFGNG
jgi:replicative DNA helicase